LFTLTFDDFYFFLTPTFLLLFSWLFFFKVNNNFLKTSTEVSTNINIIKVNSNSAFVDFYYYILILLLTNIYTLHGRNSIIWFNHFNLTNFTLYLIYLFLFVGFSIYFLLKSVLKKTNLVKSIDYLFSINNLVVLLPLLFLVNTVFTFLFLLELISVVLLYKLISSKIWFKNQNKIKNINNNIPQSYINMIFFQYWVTFFSTIFIIYFYINLFYMYGTSDWYVIQYITTTGILDVSFTNTILHRILVSVFLFSIFFKLGVTPFHLFKIEVYKGIPLLSIFFYTTYYFVVFFIFFLYFLSDFIATYVIYYYLILVLLLFVGSCYTIVLLFDVSFLKAFFTYSTIINTIGFLTAFVAAL